MYVEYAQVSVALSYEFNNLISVTSIETLVVQCSKITRELVQSVLTSVRFNSGSGITGVSASGFLKTPKKDNKPWLCLSFLQVKVHNI